ncbi:MAG TPA: energy transducer TonB [Chthoniobacterales bacterium]|nr:energy transducer TonB [Chthoniobacterales bacterium]
MVTRLRITFLPIAGALGATLLFSSADAHASPERVPTPPPSHGRVYGHGSGLVGIDVDFATGKVTAVRVIASTGHRDLDQAALKAFRKSRFKPRTVRHVRTPITFRIKDRKL